MQPIILSSVVISGMAAGQILFKSAAGSGSLVEILLSPLFWGAAVLYGVVTIAWVLLLKEVDLTRAYPIMAATYVIVPIAAGFFFGEKFGPIYGLGVTFIVVGIVLTRFG
ncbi:MAG TPA: transporter [Hyphomicrobiaceae bacterium]|nr:transporter [Hyphomicrobiaceae bacterium]